MLSYGPPFLLVVDVAGGSTFDRRMSTDRVFCQVFLSLPTGAFPSTTNLVHAFCYIGAKHGLLRNIWKEDRSIRNMVAQKHGESIVDRKKIEWRSAK